MKTTNCAVITCPSPPPPQSGPTSNTHLQAEVLVHLGGEVPHLPEAALLQCLALVHLRPHRLLHAAQRRRDPQQPVRRRGVGAGFGSQRALQRGRWCMGMGGGVQPWSGRWVSEACALTRIHKRAHAHPHTHTSTPAHRQQETTIS